MRLFKCNIVQVFTAYPELRRYVGDTACVFSSVSGMNPNLNIMRTRGTLHVDAEVNHQEIRWFELVSSSF